MNKPASTPKKARFNWADDVEITYNPNVEGDSMSLSDGEIIIDALNAERLKAVQELEWLFKSMVKDELDKPDNLRKLLSVDCRNALNVIKSLNLYTEMITNSAMADVRMIAAQYPDLIDNRDHDDER